MTTTEQAAAPKRQRYGAATPPWVDLAAIVPADELRELHDAAEEYGDLAADLSIRARKVWNLLALVEDRERAAYEAAGPDGEFGDGLAAFLNGITGSQDVRMLLHAVANALHPEELERIHHARRGAVEEGV